MWAYFRKMCKEWGNKARKWRWPQVRAAIKEETRQEVEDLPVYDENGEEADPIIAHLVNQAWREGSAFHEEPEDA